MKMNWRGLQDKHHSLMGHRPTLIMAADGLAGIGAVGLPSKTLVGEASTSSTVQRCQIFEQ